MALSSRICLLALCVLVLPAAAAAGTSNRKAMPVVVANPAPLLPAPKPQPKPVTLGQRAVRIAAQELGVPYRYGGSSPSGFDCSGLTSWVYGKLGVSLPHNAAAQYGYGRPVDLGHIKPGDLLFFHGLGHVGMYIGHGRFIHAPQSGERVSIQSLASRSGTIDGARRLRRA